jgi:predicted amidohydrolase YtcJ
MRGLYGTRATQTASIAPDDLNRSARLADGRGWQIMMHAEDDDAVRMALDAYQHAARSNLAPPRGRRHRIEHAESVDTPDVVRFGALEVLASVQPLDMARGGPVGASSPPERAEALVADRAGIAPLDAVRGRRLYSSVTAAGGRLTFGSDWPAATMNPLLGLHAAVKGTTKDEDHDGRRKVNERLPLKTALTAYTSAPAWASFDEHRKGTLEPGMLADIVVLSKDIFDAPPAELVSTTVEVTIFDGKIVYRRGARPDVTD